MLDESEDKVVRMTAAATPELELAEKEMREAKEELGNSDLDYQKQ